ncbi:MAG: hypothetical protein IJ283_07740 [Oscillospiraceae bacterium]|nr:hypothetical protein [Oscillospiraceae bacterium]
MKKKTFYTEIAYVLAIISLGFGVAFAAKAGFGVSMIAAPAYTIHLKLLEMTSAVTLGTIEYILQGIVIVLLALFVGKFKISYLFSFVTAVFSGLAIDFAIWAIAAVPSESIVMRGVLFFTSLICCAFGVSCFFHTYVAPAAHELFVKEFAKRFGKDINKTKSAYDITLCIISIILNLVFFGGFKGIGLGTVVTALVNGLIIAKVTMILEKHFEFKDAFPKLEKYFEK